MLGRQIQQVNARRPPNHANPGRFAAQAGPGKQQKGLGTDDILWYHFVAFDALVSPLER
jgi:hypothetical protein